ncbi:MAG: ATP-grasp domain-containing protein, partial [Phycisphaeraceae bacterium]|nr:ATP-grasp domain-containing protein [Phycisphaeraceae bacterium]
GPSRHAVSDGATTAVTFDQLAAASDATLVVAPEMDDILGRWLDRLTDQGHRNLNSTPDAVRLTGDKLALADHLTGAGVSTPPLCPWPGEAAEGTFVKPRFGVGCVFTFTTPPTDQPPVEMVVGPRRPGAPASVTWLIGDDRADPIAVAAQHLIEEDGQLHYRGGHFDLPAEQHKRAIPLARRALDAVEGLRGIVGVDLLLGDSPADDCVIEINPRATVSYAAAAFSHPGRIADAWLTGSSPSLSDSLTGTFDDHGRMLEASPS